MKEAQRIPRQVLAAALMLLPASLAFAYTAEDLAAKNIEAKGGLENLRAIHTLKLSGTVRVNGGTIELAYVALVKLPDAVRYEAQLQGLTQVQAFDGSQAWQINPFQGRKDPEKLSADDAKALGESAADMVGALVDYKQKGYTLDYLGTEDVDGTNAHKLRVTRPNGDINYVYLDPDYFLEIRTLSRRIEHGVPIEIVTDYGDYEKVNGVYLPLAQKSGPKNSTDRQQVQFESVETNIAIEDAVFHFPAVRSAAAPGK
jgi:outer membrane lipoprotein-sorting protein